MVTWAEQKKKTRDKVVKERSEIVLFVYLFVYSLSLSPGTHTKLYSQSEYLKCIILHTNNELSFILEK
jgi:hypothetical protein